MLFCYSRSCTSILTATRRWYFVISHIGKCRANVSLRCTRPPTILGLFDFDEWRTPGHEGHKPPVVRQTPFIVRHPPRTLRQVQNKATLHRETKRTRSQPLSNIQFISNYHTLNLYSVRFPGPQRRWVGVAAAVKLESIKLSAVYFSVCVNNRGSHYKCVRRAPGDGRWLKKKTASPLSDWFFVPTPYISCLGCAGEPRCWRRKGFINLFI